MKHVAFIVVFALGAVLGFGLCQYLDGQLPTAEVPEIFKSDTSQSNESNEVTNTADSDTTPSLERSIPLRDLPLTDSQKKTAATFGIDVETFIITPAMMVCAEGKLGKARLDAIIGGSSVSFTESLSLMGCLSAD